MARPNTIHIEDIGPVLFERSSRAKHLNISIKPFKGVRVAIPKGMSFKKAEEIALLKADWIKKHLTIIQQIEEKLSSTNLYFECIDKDVARKKLTCRLKDLADKHGFFYNSVNIRNQKTRWGSCSEKNNISLNMKLVKLPGELMDYVLLHELLHTRIKNHSKDFWTEIDKLVGNAKTKRRKLKIYNMLF